MDTRVSHVKRKVTIPPYWVEALIGLLALMFGLWLKRSGEEDGADIRFFCFVGIGILVKSGFHFSIRPKGIGVLFCWIPVRLIRWEKIASAEYIEKWSTGGRFGQMEGQGIAVTLHTCPAFVAEIDALNFFQVKHPFSFCFIRFTRKNRKKNTTVFQQYYPGLSFQLGCDTSWLKED